MSNKYEEKYKDLVDNLERSGKLDYLLGEEERHYFYLEGLSLDKEDEDVIRFLDVFGYEVVSYKDGFAKSKGGKKKLRIGSVLNKIEKRTKKDTELTYKEKNSDKYLKYMEDRDREEVISRIRKNFENSPFRHSSKDLVVVISRNKHDIARMSTGRNWTSCFSLSDEQLEEDPYIIEEIRHGGLVAYLTLAGDNEIEKPLARILIRRFEDVNKVSFACVEDRIYGIYVPAFLKAVKKWLFEKTGHDRLPKGIYRMHGAEYSDTFEDYHVSDDYSIEDLIDIFNFKNPYIVSGNRIGLKPVFLGFMEQIYYKRYGKDRVENYFINRFSSDFRKIVNKYKEISFDNIYEAYSNLESVNRQYRNDIYPIRSIGRYSQDSFLELDIKEEEQKIKLFVNESKIDIAKMIIERMTEDEERKYKYIYKDIEKYIRNLLEGGKIGEYNARSLISVLIDNNKEKFISSDIIDDYITSVFATIKNMSKSDGAESYCLKSLHDLEELIKAPDSFFCLSLEPEDAFGYYEVGVNYYLKNLKLLSIYMARIISFCGSLPEPSLMLLKNLMENSSIPMDFIAKRKFDTRTSNKILMVYPVEIKNLGLLLNIILLRSFIKSNAKTKSVVDMVRMSIPVYELNKKLVLDSIINLEEKSVYFYSFVLNRIKEIEENVDISVLMENKQDKKIIKSLRKNVEEDEIIKESIARVFSLRVLYESLRHVDHYIFKSLNESYNYKDNNENPFRYFDYDGYIMEVIDEYSMFNTNYRDIEYYLEGVDIYLDYINMISRNK